MAGLPCFNVWGKRLCGQAADETREVVAKICAEVVKVNPEFKDLLVPLCVYRGGICEEFHPCGFNKTGLEADST